MSQVCWHGGGATELETMTLAKATRVVMLVRGAPAPVERFLYAEMEALEDAVHQAGIWQTGISDPAKDKVELIRRVRQLSLKWQSRALRQSRGPA